MQAIVVEDSRLARKELLRLLEQHPEIEVIAQSEDIQDAKRKIKSLKPELIFLDINMPGGDGFELLQQLDNCPKIIFTTAYDEFAIKAFECNALDYLLKPINPVRLKQAIEKVLTFANKDNFNKITETIDHKIFLKDGERCWLIDLEQVRYIESCGNYSRIYFNDKRPMLYKSLNKIEPRLKEKTFIRVNRQYIININFVSSIESEGINNLVLYMNDGKEIEVSRRYGSKMKQLLSF